GARVPRPHAPRRIAARARHPDGPRPGRRETRPSRFAPEQTRRTRPGSFAQLPSLCDPEALAGARRGDRRRDGGDRRRPDGLLRGRPGVSAFFMTPGLDDGDVLAARELEPLKITLPAGSRNDADTLYRALFSFIDPLIRAELLVGDVLEPVGDLGALSATPQD